MASTKTSKQSPSNNEGFFENLFKLKEHGTDTRTEIIAGLTTFMTMAYIIVVNPSM